MALLALQDANNGLDLAFAAAAGGGDTIPQGAESGGWALPVVLVVKNGGAGAITVTVAGLPAGVSIAAGGTGIFPVVGGIYGVARAITYSGVTSVTVAAARLTGVQE